MRFYRNTHSRLKDIVKKHGRLVIASAAVCVTLVVVSLTAILVVVIEDGNTDIQDSDDKQAVQLPSKLLNELQETNNGSFVIL